MNEQKLFMLLLGCRPKGRHIEQHDIFFTVASSLAETVPAINHFWKDSGTIHIDSWRLVTEVDGYSINVKPNSVQSADADTSEQLFFINLGGYKPGDLEEYHYKMLVVAPDTANALKKAKDTFFYKEVGFEGAVSHIDDKYGIDIDELYAVKDILPETIKEAYSIVITKNEVAPKDELHIGYQKLSSLVVK